MNYFWYPYLQAILNCNEALRLRPNSVRALLCRGALKFKIGAYRHSIRDLNQAIELDKQCALAYYNRAVCSHRTNNHDDALRVRRLFSDLDVKDLISLFNVFERIV